MDDLLRKLPPGVVAAIVIGLGLLGILYFNPLHTPCDAQEQIFKDSLKPMFFTDNFKKIRNKKPQPLYPKFVERCKDNPNQGSCLKWFQAIGKLEEVLQNQPSECVESSLSIKEIKEAVKEAPELLIRIAWGNRAPISSFKRTAWMDRFHLAGFCTMKDLYLASFPQSSWDDLREELLEDLPGAVDLGRDEAYRRSLFSINCDRM
ncbi:MAG: hypothetical protein AB8E15_11680 [Bdellovibrionales bacterium]